MRIIRTLLTFNLLQKMTYGCQIHTQWLCRRRWGGGGVIRIVEVTFYWGLFDWEGGWTLSEGAWRRSAEMSASELSTTKYLIVSELKTQFEIFMNVTNVANNYIWNVCSTICRTLQGLLSRMIDNPILFAYLAVWEWMRYYW